MPHTDAQLLARRCTLVTLATEASLKTAPHGGTPVSTAAVSLPPSAAAVDTLSDHRFHSQEVAAQ